jgi:hypothetical protein
MIKRLVRRRNGVASRASCLSEPSTGTHETAARRPPLNLNLSVRLGHTETVETWNVQI